MIGQLFGKAGALYRRDFIWLIIAGLIVALILGALTVGVAAVTGASLSASVQDSLGDGTPGSADEDALGGSLAVAGIVLLLLGAVSAILQMVFLGGMYEMVIAGDREGHRAQLGDLFSGFRRLGAYVVLALLYVGVVVATFLVLALLAYVMGPFLLFGLLGAFAVLVWLGIAWVYAIPLIVDRGMGAVEAVGESMSMVKSVGWWRTFAMLFLLGVLFIAASILIGIVSGGSDSVSTALSVLFQIFFSPFAVCYVATMYLGSAPSLRPSAAPARISPGGPSAPPLPPGYVPPPSYEPAGGPAPAAPPSAYEPAAPPAYEAPASQPPSRPVSADADAWRAAADPLAAMTGTMRGAGPATQGAPQMAHDHDHHDHQTPGSQIEPGVDAGSGRLEQHCSQCGTVLEGSDEFCQVCAIEVSGGEEPQAPDAPQAPNAPS